MALATTTWTDGQKISSINRQQRPPSSQQYEPAEMETPGAPESRRAAVSGPQENIILFRSMFISFATWRCQIKQGSQNCGPETAALRLSGVSGVSGSAGTPYSVRQLHILAYVRWGQDDTIDNDTQPYSTLDSSTGSSGCMSWILLAATQCLTDFMNKINSVSVTKRCEKTVRITVYC